MGGVIVRTEDWSYRKRWELRTQRSPLELTELVFDGEMGSQAQIGLANEEQVWEWVNQELGLSPTEGEEFRRDFFAGDRVDQDLVNYIRGLRKTMKTGLLSNAFKEIRTWLEKKWQIADAFDQLLISAEVGTAKPDEQIYHLALENLGVTPEQTIFIDDALVNIQAAQEIGILGIHFISPDSTIHQIEALLEHSDVGK
jgi:putative hydrolase of the HAD superfamily